jgi:peptidoglycan/xylan/chitin deacetylase (PgdA/CDA1 family)
MADPIHQRRRGLFRHEKLRVLMYHGVSGGSRRDALTVDSGQLEAHFQYLRSNGYNTILLSDLIAYYDHKRPLPPKPVLITFDDGFLNNYQIAYPLAEKYQVKINFFVVPAFIRSGIYRDEACMQEEDIRRLDGALVEIGLHSYRHSSYAALIPSRIKEDLEHCRTSLTSMGISYQPCLAYPYGAYPKRKGYDQTRLFEILGENGIHLAFRIGNRINSLPLRNKFLIQRLDIRGDEPFLLFRISLAFGRKLFGLPGLIRSVSSWTRKPAVKAIIALCLGAACFLSIIELIRACHGCRHSA